MDEALPGFENRSDVQQETLNLSTNSAQTKDVFRSDEPVTNRRSGHLTSPGTKRHGMTNFDDINVQQDLLDEFDPLSSHSNTTENDFNDGDPSGKKKTSVQRLDSKKNMEPHRSSGLILGNIQETSLAVAPTNSGDERILSGCQQTEYSEQVFENGGKLERGEVDEDIDGEAEVVDEGKNSHIHQSSFHKFSACLLL